MFKKIEAFFLKRRAERIKKESEEIRVISNILLMLLNSVKAMKSLTEEQKKTVYDTYISTIYKILSDKGKIIFSSGLVETQQMIDQIYNNIPTSEIQVRNQLRDLFRSI